MSALTSSPAWQALQAHAQDMAGTHLRDLFAADPQRFAKLSLRFEDLLLDYSKHRVDARTMGLLFDLARHADVENWRAMMFEGAKINHTEHRAVLHVALRNRGNRPILVDGRDVSHDVRAVLERIKAFTEDVRGGRWTGHTGKRITDVVNIGIGGSDLGPVMDRGPQALRHQGSPPTSSPTSTAPPAPTLKDRPRSTLFIVASKTFTTQETMTNAVKPDMAAPS